MKTLSAIVASLMLATGVPTFGQDYSDEAAEAPAQAPPPPKIKLVPVPPPRAPQSEAPSVRLPPGSAARPAIPRSSPARWINSVDYPVASLVLGEGGVTVFTATVDRAGRVAACAISKSSGYASLDEATCRAIGRRARFHPALDDSGQPTQGSYTQTVRWQMPEYKAPSSRTLGWENPTAPSKNQATGTVSFHLRISAQGKLARCSIEDSSGSEALDEATCKNLRKVEYFTPDFDAYGNAIERNFYGKIKWLETPPHFKLRLN